MSEELSVLTEEVTLPSRGLIYPKEMGVPESLPIKPFKTKDLKALFGSNSLAALNSLIQNCINIPVNFNAKDLHTEDRSLLFTRLRAITLGSVYKSTKQCSECKGTFDVEWNLDELLVDYLDLDEYPIKIELPDSGKELYVGVNLPKDVQDIQSYVNKKRSYFKNKNEFDESSETIFGFYASSIKILDGIYPSLETKIDFLLSCSPEDFGYLKSVNDMLKFGIDNERIVKCPNCGVEHTVILSQTEEFFRRSSELPKGIRVQKKLIKSNTK